MSWTHVAELWPTTPQRRHLYRARKYLNVSDGAPPATYQLASDWLKSAGGSLDLSASHDVAGISRVPSRAMLPISNSLSGQRVDNA